MKYRIAMWAVAGLIVAGGWAIYFLVASKDHSIEPIVSTLVRLTCPVAIVGSHYPVSLDSALVVNVATYALVGLVLETLRRQFNHSK
jgi:tellurite resistance protein TehA-like permease